jgi:hypothetical protein
MKKVAFATFFILCVKFEKPMLLFKVTASGYLLIQICLIIGI